MSTQAELYQLKGMISEFTQLQQDQVREVAKVIRDAVEATGQAGKIALILVALEMAVEEE